jgi:lysophospholipase L1-like esterase
MRLGHRWVALLVVALCVGLVGPVAGASASVHKKTHMSAKAKRVARARLLRAIKKNPRLVSNRSFVKKASLVNFKLPVTIRLRNSSVATNPNVANLDLGASLGKRTLGLGGSLAGEIVFHDSYDGGALGNVDITLNPGPKTLTTTSLPLLWNTDVTAPGTSIAPTFQLGAGAAGCNDFHGATPVTIAGHQTVPFWNLQAAFDSSAAPDGYVPDTPGVDDPARLVASAAVGSDDNLGGNPQPFPYTGQSTPGGFTQPPSPGDSVLRTAPLALGIAPAGTEVNQSDGSANGPQGSQNVVLGKSGGQANLFGNIPGKGTGIDITVNLGTRINSILRSVDPEFVPLITGNHWPTTWSDCRQAYTGAVQNYITGVHLKGSLHISPAITPDGHLRIAKATLTSADPARVALAACLYPYSLYTAENNNSDTQSQTVGSYTTGGQLPTNEFVARKAPTNVDCASPATKLVTDAPTLGLTAANAANGYTTSVDGSRVSVSGDITTSVSADVLIGDVDSPPSSASALGNQYLALGDSIAYGYQAGKFAANAIAGGDCNSAQAGNPANVCESHFHTGYVDLFGNYLKKINPSLTVINDGCPGEKTPSLLNGYLPSVGPGLCGKGSGFPYTFLHHNYGFGNSQLQNALSVLAANPSTTNPVTIDIGANDLLDFLTGCGFPSSPTATTCISNGLAAQYATITGNINSILTQMQAVAPNARYMVMGLYNPYPTLLSLGGGLGGDASTAQLNSQIRALAINHGARFVDPLPVFNPSGATGGSETGDVGTICALTGMCPGGTFNPASPAADIHPSDKGYAALASLFESASGF